jgi:hypothetical protein
MSSIYDIKNVFQQKLKLLIMYARLPIYKLFECWIVLTKVDSPEGSCHDSIVWLETGLGFVRAITNSHNMKFTTARTKSSQFAVSSPVVWRFPTMSFASVLTSLQAGICLTTHSVFELTHSQVGGHLRQLPTLLLAVAGVPRKRSRSSLYRPATDRI